MPLIVFTDLDGSLMEHEGYSVEPARDALAQLARREIPLILNSSKTAAEIEAIQELLALRVPFVCENGAALHLAAGETVVFGARREHWLKDVHALREDCEVDFQGFADWSAAAVSELTGLSHAQAKQAKQRIYSEPILWRDSEPALQRFQSALEKMDLRLLQGGRFLSIQGQFDKRDAIDWMVADTAKQQPADLPVVVALGDSPNDAAMLNAADVAVVIKSPKSDLIDCSGARRLIYSKHPGPTGWNEAMLEILALRDGGQL